MLVRLILTFSLLRITVSHSSIHDLTIQIINDIFQMSHSRCSGTIIIVSESYRLDNLLSTQDLISKLIEIEDFNPVTILDSDITSTWEDSWDKAPFCQNVIVFQHRRPPPSILVDIKARFFINKVVMVTKYSQLEAHTLLQSLSHENIVVLSKTHGKSLRLYQWRASNQIYQSIFPSSFIHQPQLINEIRLKNGMRTDLSGRHLKIGSIDFPPHVWIGQDHGSGHQGIEPSLIEIMSRHLNFTYQYVQASSDEMWGEILGHEGSYTFTGLMGMVVRKEADAIFGLFYLPYLRWPFMGYTNVYKNNYESFLVPASPPVDRNYFLCFYHHHRVMHNGPLVALETQGSKERRVSRHSFLRSLRYWQFAECSNATAKHHVDCASYFPHLVAIRYINSNDAVSIRIDFLHDIPIHSAGH